MANASKTPRKTATLPPNTKKLKDHKATFIQEATPWPALAVSPISGIVHVGVAKPLKLKLEKGKKGKAKQKASLYAEQDWIDISNYVSTLASLLRLQGWTITLSREHALDENVAEINITPMQKRATLSVHAQFLDPRKLDPVTDIPQWQRHTLTHELLHLIVNPILHIADDVTTAGMGRKTQEVAISAINHQVESSVDALADAIAPMLPLPHWTTQPLKLRIEQALKQNQDQKA